MKLELCEMGPDSHGLESISPFCMKVHRALRFYGLPYERRYAMRPSDHKEYSPTGQAPVLLIDGDPVPDSTAIIKALDKLASRSLIPEDPGQRSDAWLWEDYADQVLGYYVFAARWYDDRNWAALKKAHFGVMPVFLRSWLPDRIRKRLLRRMSPIELFRSDQASCWAEFQARLDLLESRAPETGFWTGDEMTVADIGLFGMLHCMRSDLSQWQMDQINQRLRLRAWLDRVDAATN